MLRQDGRVFSGIPFPDDETAYLHPYFLYEGESDMFSSIEMMSQFPNGATFFYENTTQPLLKQKLTEWVNIVYTILADYGNLSDESKDIYVEWIYDTFSELPNDWESICTGEIIDIIDVDIESLLIEINRMCNQEFLRMRLGGQYSSTSSLKDHLYCRVSSVGFNWYNNIFYFLDEHKSIKYITISYDRQAGRGNMVLSIKGSLVSDMPVDEFCSFSGRPVVESFVHSALEGLYAEGLKKGLNIIEAYPFKKKHNYTKMYEKIRDNYIKENFVLIEDSDSNECFMMRNDGKVFKGINDDGNYIHPYLLMYGNSNIYDSIEDLGELPQMLTFFHDNTLSSIVKSNLEEIASLFKHFKEYEATHDEIPKEWTSTNFFDYVENIEDDTIQYWNSLIHPIEEEVTIDMINHLTNLLIETNDMCNQEFLRMRLGGAYMREEDTLNHLYCRISSKEFNWYDNIFYFLDSHKSIDTITIEYDWQSGRGEKVLTIRGEYISDYPVSEFISLKGRPVVEKLKFI